LLRLNSALIEKALSCSQNITSKLGVVNFLFNIKKPVGDHPDIGADEYNPARIPGTPQAAE